MKMQSIHVFRMVLDTVPTWRAVAEISVPGLGDVSIHHALSDETCEQIAHETETALRAKMGQLDSPRSSTERSK